MAVLMCLSFLWHYQLKTYNVLAVAAMYRRDKWACHNNIHHGDHHSTDSCSRSGKSWWKDSQHNCQWSETLFSLPTSHFNYAVNLSYVLEVFKICAFESRSLVIIMAPQYKYDDMTIYFVKNCFCFYEILMLMYCALCGIVPSFDVILVSYYCLWTQTLIVRGFLYSNSVYVCEWVCVFVYYYLLLLLMKFI